MKRPAIRIYQIGENDWVAATNAKEALTWWQKENGADEEPETKALTQSQLNSHIYWDEDLNRSLQFKSELRKRRKAGEKFPQMFATRGP